MNHSSPAHDPAYGAEFRKIHVIQGEFHVAEGEDVVLTTILGSCVAACIRDPVLGIGGMNHFLLPGATGDEGLRYGVQSMELLLNALLRKGARRIQYWPVSGRARQILLAPTESKVFATERRQPVAKVEDTGALELF